MAKGICRGKDGILYSDILDLIERQAKRFPDKIAIEDTSSFQLSYNDLAATVRQFSQFLTGHGIERGSRVAIVLPNGVEMAVALLGVSTTAVAVPLNPAYRAEEFQSYFETIRVGFMIAFADGAPAARKAAAEMGIKVLELSCDGGFVLSCATGCEFPMTNPSADNLPPEPSDIAAILMTSGSTGGSKKVPLTHRNLCTSVRDSCRSMALQPEDRCLCIWEQFHISGLNGLLMAPLAAGGAVICAPRFDPAEFFRLLETKKPTWFMGVPTVLQELALHAARNPAIGKPTSLRFICSGAAALPSQLLTEIETLFGVPVLSTYGMTEAAPSLTSMRLPPAVRKAGSVGLSCGPEIRILDPGGVVLAPGETGEVVARGDNFASCYEDDAEATAQSFRDGWYHTGDTGYLDEDGHLFLKGRLKQMINRGGEKVNPQEIDDVLLAHPAVAEVAAFAVKHRTLGEDVAVAVVLRPSARATEDELRNFVAKHLASFKVPQRVLFFDQLPRNAVGKLDRLALAEMAETLARPSGPAGTTSALEERIAKIWAAEMNLPVIGLDDNFFASGGDSLSGVRVFLAVERAFGRPLPERALVNITTVREMARLIGTDDNALPAHPTEMAESSLTETERRSLAIVMAMESIPVMQPGSAIKAVNMDGRRTPIFWCFTSPAEQMQGLMQHLNPDQPLYGLYSGGRLFPTTDAVASKIGRFYAGEIISLSPEGPYVIGGNCQGANVAVEIARNLAASGRKVEKLCLAEYSDTSLYNFEGQLLLMFGKQSKFRAYRPIRWGEPGWRAPFCRSPVVEWVSGEHGRLLHPDNAVSLAGKLDRFLQGQPQYSGSRARIESSVTMAIHKIPVLFTVYRKVNRLAKRMLRAKRHKLSLFTGEPEA